MIGIGLNVHSPTRPGPIEGRMPVSLAELGCGADRLAVLEALLGHLHQAIAQIDDTALHDAWLRRAALLQHRVTVENDGRRKTGRVVELDPQHGLILEVEEGSIVAFPAATTSIVDDQCANSNQAL